VQGGLKPFHLFAGGRKNMSRERKKRILAVLIVCILIVSVIVGYILLNPESKSPEIVPNSGNQNYSIASWNLKTFGSTNGADGTLLNYYADKLNDYDIFVVQGIIDISGEAIGNLADRLPAYEYIISQRAGRNSSKEQYAIFYNSKASLVNYYDWTDDWQNEYERPPFHATFTVENWTFVLITIHTEPENVAKELTYLEERIGDSSIDTILLGNLNADGIYYDEDNIEHFTNWKWVITNDMDTTVSTDNNSYDRIIINNAVENNFVNAGVMDDVDIDQNDHYLVYAVFNPDESTEIPTYPENQLIINEFELNPQGTDLMEWVELYNPTNQTLWIEGWSLLSKNGENKSLYATVNPYYYMVIELPGQWLDDNDEGLILLDSNNQEIDSTPIKTDSSDDDFTWSRLPNAMDTDSDNDWVFQPSTKGYSNNNSVGRLLINEFELNPVGPDNGSEWVELFNPTDDSIDLTDWSLKNKGNEVYPLSGYIDSNGYRIITFSVELLNNSDEMLTLLSPSFQEIDSTPSSADIYDDDRSWQRIPDGIDTESESDWAFQSSTKDYSNR
jgi:hypothetical protein